MIAAERKNTLKRCFSRRVQRIGRDFIFELNKRVLHLKDNYKKECYTVTRRTVLKEEERLTVHSSLIFMTSVFELRQNMVEEKILLELAKPYFFSASTDGQLLHKDRQKVSKALCFF
jgi:hypothetical protein